MPISNARVARGLSYPSLVVFRLRIVFFFGGNDLDSVPVRVVTGLVTSVSSVTAVGSVAAVSSEAAVISEAAVRSVTVVSFVTAAILVAVTAAILVAVTGPNSSSESYESESRVLLHPFSMPTSQPKMKERCF